VDRAGRIGGAHGLVDRPSEDLDLFTNRLEPEESASAVAVICDAYRGRWSRAPTMDSGLMSSARC
jgi:hypothetical protein